ncbi:MAG: hypothetical protein QUS08_00775 [Methanothrix sp.]|nr:hypothetical protein [Methanothrix sp.]
MWLRENSPATSFFESPSRAAEYSVMSWWDYGNWILYLTRRPVVANNFQAGYEDAATFYLSEEEREATEVLDRRGSRYILTDFGLVYGKLPALTTWAGKDISDYMTMEAQGGRIEATPTRRLYNTTMARLYLFDGSGMGRFRLIYESPTLVGSNPPKSQVKIFEYVPGALIRVRAGPEKRAGALLNMTSNQGRSFTYINEALPVNGAFEMRVPYSTEGGAGTHATGPYMVFAGDRQGVTIQSLNVSEEDVLHGRTLEVAL